MRSNVALRYIGTILLLNAAFMFIAAIISYANNVDSGFGPLMLSAILTSVLGAFPRIFVDRGSDISNKESFVIVVGSWILSCIVGMFPYLLWGGEFVLSTAWFESVSGFTTTGASALTDVESLPKGLLFWRSVTHWLGGVGVVMFSLLILPSLGRSKMTLSSIEMSPMAKDNYRFRAQKIAHILIVVYVGMTIAEFLLLALAGMGLFDAVNIAMSTVSTGGFSVTNNSIVAYDSVWVEMIIVFFMLVSGLHFGLIYATLIGKGRNIFNSEVSRFYFAVVGFSVLAVAVSLFIAGTYPDLWSSLRYSLFQVSAYVSTTGFATADTNLWTPVSMVILVFLSMMCACAGSTCGGIKTDRIWIALKAVRAEILRQQHPDAVIPIKVDGTVHDRSVVSAVVLFIFIYLLVILIGTLVVTIAGLDLLTGFTSVVACMGNVGPGFGEAGSMGNYASFSPLLKSVFAALMLFGRLEIFGLLQIFILKWWR